VLAQNNTALCKHETHFEQDIKVKDHNNHSFCSCPKILISILLMNALTFNVALMGQ